MTEPIEIKCVCGAVIPDDDIYYRNKENEEGECYYIVDAECPACHKEYETSEYGEAEDKEEAKETLAHYIKGIIK